MPDFRCKSGRKIDSQQCLVDLGRFNVEYRDIAVAIKAGRYESAKCAADLGASAMYDDLKSCLANQDCKAAAGHEIQKAAPEVLGEAPLKFTYLKSKDRVRSCV